MGKSLRSRRGHTPSHTNPGSLAGLLSARSLFSILSFWSVTLPLYSTTISRTLRQPLRSRVMSGLPRIDALRLSEKSRVSCQTKPRSL